MSIKGLKYLLLLPLMWISVGVMAQETKADSLQRKNSEYLSELRTKMNDTKATAKEANEVATESRRAYRSEQKAQKARKNADRQAKRARKALVASKN